jgi:hypothetical protein
MSLPAVSGREDAPTTAIDCGRNNASNFDADFDTSGFSSDTNAKMSWDDDSIAIKSADDRQTSLGSPNNKPSNLDGKSSAV